MIVSFLHQITDFFIDYKARVSRKRELRQPESAGMKDTRALPFGGSMTKQDIKDLMRIGSAKPVELEDLLGDNFPSDAMERLAEYRAEEAEYLRDRQEDR